MNMRKYWEMIKSQIKIGTAYTAWFWAGTFSTIVYMLVIYYFWHAVYENQTEVANMQLSTMITYTVLAMMLGQYVTGVGDQLARSIKDGSVAIELMRPYDFLLKLVALDLGDKITSTMRDTLPMLLVAYTFLGISKPHSWEAAGLFVISSLLGVLIGTQFDLFAGVFAFWTVNVWGLGVLKRAILLFFTGSLIPVSLFPHWLQQVSFFLPFQSMVYVPVSIYTGTISGVNAYIAIGEQIVWLAAAYLIVRFIWSKALKQVTIFGG